MVVGHLGQAGQGLAGGVGYDLQGVGLSGDKAIVRLGATLFVGLAADGLDLFQGIEALGSVHDMGDATGAVEVGVEGEFLMGCAGHVSRSARHRRRPRPA